MKIISFIGNTNYSETTYTFNDKIEVQTAYFPYAVNKVYNPEDHYIFMTDESKKMHSEKLSLLFKFNEVNIPIGKNEDEFWEIFDVLIQCVSDNDELIIDFTYGFRSQAILVIAAVIFLKSLRKIKIKKILYGAFEAKDKESNSTPVFDLTSFVELIDWSYAVYDFINYSKAGELSKLLADIQKYAYSNEIKPESLKSSGVYLKDISESLSVVNLKDIFCKAFLFSEKSVGLINDLKKIAKTKPLALLLNEITKRIEPISNAEKQMFNEKGLQAQISIIQWYIETGQFQQAITLMNELFITVNCIKKKKDPLLLKERTSISDEFGERIGRLKVKSLDQSLKDETVVWNRLSETRNEINHAGMKESQSNTVNQIKNILELFNLLKNYISELNL